jgi:hypothetical protein
MMKREKKDDERRRSVRAAKQQLNILSFFLFSSTTKQTFPTATPTQAARAAPAPRSSCSDVRFRPWRRRPWRRHQFRAQSSASWLRRWRNISGCRRRRRRCCSGRRRRRLAASTCCGFCVFRRDEQLSQPVRQHHSLLQWLLRKRRSDLERECLPGQSLGSPLAEMARYDQGWLWRALWLCHVRIQRNRCDGRDEMGRRRSAEKRRRCCCWRRRRVCRRWRRVSVRARPG